MPVVSSPVAAGMPIKADQFNKLRQDLLSNHDHDGAASASVDHGDLTDVGTMAGVFHTHANAETHINGTDGAFDDDPGGNAGVHGLPAGARVAGYVGHVTQTTNGAASFVNDQQWVFVVGNFLTISGHDFQIDFGYTFDEPPYVMCTAYKDDTDGLAGNLGIYTYDIVTNHFHCITSYSSNLRPERIHWMAIGRPAS